MTANATSGGPALQERFQEAVLAFFDAREAGVEVDVEDLFKRFPDVQGPLKEFLASQGLLQEALAPLVRLGPADEQLTLPSFRSYHVHGLIGQGGVGAVFRARDWVLNRDLAIKVLHQHHAAFPGLVQRFIAEAQIGAQLQHPGVVPVHEVGTVEDGRPYFTMKLIRGRTLAAILAERTSPSQDLPHLLTIFEKVCQAVAYAHSKNVLHRDLKPSNIMVGPFGEVLVVDWGLAKVLDPMADERVVDQPTTSSVVQTVRQGQAHAVTQLGSLLGTYEYMPPEQARGEVHRVGKPSDVFGLGAVLCQILTGRPPYSGRNRKERRELAAAAALGPAFDRLDHSGAGAPLVELAKRCLEEEPGRRPPDAAAVAVAVSEYQDGVREELRRAELQRARAEQTLFEERKKRREHFTLLTLVFLVLLTSAAVGGLLLWNRQQRRLTATRDVSNSLARVEVLCREARTLPPDRATAALSLYKQAHEVAEQATLRSNSSGLDRDTLARLQGWKEEVESGLQATQNAVSRAERERGLVNALDAAALAAGLRLINLEIDNSQTVRMYKEAFSHHDIDLSNGEQEDVVARLRSLSPSTRTRAVEALDHWGLVERDRTRSARLLAVASAVDCDDWRGQVRRAWLNGHLTRMRELAANLPSDASPSASLLLAHALYRWHYAAEAAAVLYAAQARSPDQFWVNLELGNCLLRLGGPRCSDAITYYRVAISCSPRSSVAWNNLGQAFFQLQRFEEAEKALAAATRIQPSNVTAVCSRALIRLFNQQDFVGAETMLREAYREQPDSAMVLAFLGTALIAQGKASEGSGLVREACSKAPESLPVQIARCCSSAMQGSWTDTVSSCERIVKLIGNAEDPGAVFFQGIGLLLNGDLPEAESTGRRGLKQFDFPPWRGQFNLILGVALAWEGRSREAEQRVRAALLDTPEATYLNNLLAMTLLWQGKIPEAVQTIQALRQKHKQRYPGQPDPWLQDVVLNKLKSLGADVLRIERGETQADPLFRGLQSEIALAMGKPYLAYRLLPEQLDDSSEADRLAERLPSGLWNDRGTLLFSVRFNAARAAAMAGSGRGEERRKAPQEDRAALRRRALGWLMEELKGQERAGQDLEKQLRVRRWLYYCRECPELAGVRGRESLAAMDGAERQGWENFWAESAALLGKLQAESLTGK